MKRTDSINDRIIIKQALEAIRNHQPLRLERKTWINFPTSLTQVLTICDEQALLEQMSIAIKGWRLSLDRVAFHHVLSVKLFQLAHGPEAALQIASEGEETEFPTDWPSISAAERSEMARTFYVCV